MKNPCSPAIIISSTHVLPVPDLDRVLCGGRGFPHPPSQSSSYPEMSGQKNNLLAVCESPNIPVYLPIPMYGLVVYQGRQIFPRI